MTVSTLYLRVILATSHPKGPLPEVCRLGLHWPSPPCQSHIQRTKGRGRPWLGRGMKTPNLFTTTRLSVQLVFWSVGSAASPENFLSQVDTAPHD